jgi:hypothetical protein
MLVGQPTLEQPLPVRRIDLTARLAGWKTLAAEVDRVRTRVAKATGRVPVLAGTLWTHPGHLRFYCDGQPEVYSVGIPNQTDRHSQYDLWRPNPILDAQAFHGRTFVIVGDVGPGVLAAFERVDPCLRVIHAEDGVPVAAWALWVCHGFHGFAYVGSRDPGLGY